MEAEKKRKKTGRWLVNHLKTKLTTGLLVVIPLGITIFILRFLFGVADGVFAPLIRRTVEFFFGEGSYVPGFGMIAGIAVIYIAGILTTNIFGRRFVEFGEGILTRIPLVNSIYNSSKQIINVFSSGRRGSFRQSVYVEFPREGCFSIAFITNTVRAESGKRYNTVFIPTSPNPTSGYVLILEEGQVYPTAFGVEEAMKIIMSGGMVIPDVIKAKKLQ